MPRKPSGVPVVGLDLSLRCSAAVYLPPSWSPREPREGVEWTTVGSEVVKGDYRAQGERLRDIAVHLTEFVRSHYTPHVFVEGAAFKVMFSGVMLGELSGAVKVLLLDRLGVSVVPVHMGRARKVFLGGEKLPRKGAGTVVARKVLEMGFPWETSDPGDSLVIASYGRTELGMEGIVCG